MIRRATYILAVFLTVALLATRTQAVSAGLGCFEDGANDIATCGVAADCVPVGGTDCTGGACFCTTGAQAPFCACLATNQPAAAPVLSSLGLIGLVSLLAAIGVLGLMRRGGNRRAAI